GCTRMAGQHHGGMGQANGETRNESQGQVQQEVKPEGKTMFGDGSLTFREFATGEPLPLATIHDAILEFLQDRQDAVLFGAYAVNAYVNEPRMTQEVDIASTRAEELAEELRVH